MWHAFQPDQSVTFYKSEGIKRCVLLLQATTDHDTKSSQCHFLLPYAQGCQGQGSGCNLFHTQFVCIKNAEWTLCFIWFSPLCFCQQVFCLKRGILFDLLLVVCLIESCFIFSCHICQWNAFHLGMFHYMQYPVACFSSITHLQITLFPSDGFWKDLLQNRYFLIKFCSFAILLYNLFTQWQFCCCSCCFVSLKVVMIEPDHGFLKPQQNVLLKVCSKFFGWTDIFTSLFFPSVFVP